MKLESSGPVQACTNPYNLTVTPGLPQTAASFYAALPLAAVPASAAVSVAVYLLDAAGSLTEASARPLSATFTAESGLLVPAVLTQARTACCRV